MTQRLDYEHVAPAGMKALGGVYVYVAKSELPEGLIDRSAAVKQRAC